MARFFFDHTGFVVAAILVVWAVRKLTKASVAAISYASLAWMGAIIWFTGFPFWGPGETASFAQLSIGSLVSFAGIALLSLLFEKTSLGQPSETAQIR